MTLRPSIDYAFSVARVATWLLLFTTVGWYSWVTGNDLYAGITGEPEQISDTGGVSQDRLKDSEKKPPPSERVEAPDAGTLDTSDTQILAPAESLPDPVTSQYDGSELLVVWPFLILLGLIAVWLFLRRVYTISRDVEQDPEAFVRALEKANQVIEGVNSTPRAVKRFMNRMRFGSARMRQINYRLGFLDWVAEKLGWTSEDFRLKAESEPILGDRRVVAIGTLEAFLQALPDPESDQRTPEELIAQRLALSKDDPHVAKIGTKIKALLKSAGVDRSAMQKYSRILFSMSNAAAYDLGEADSAADAKISVLKQKGSGGAAN